MVFWFRNDDDDDDDSRRKKPSASDHFIALTENPLKLTKMNHKNSKSSQGIRTLSQNDTVKLDVDLLLVHLTTLITRNCYIASRGRKTSWPMKGTSQAFVYKD
jgi:hypothetical protein